MSTFDEIKKWFEEWTKLKITLHFKERVIYFREREIWWASLGANIGYEQNGRHDDYERPILVIRKFNKEMLWALPLTSKSREGMFYYDLSPMGNKSTVILSQLRLISSRRLIRKIGAVPVADFNKIREKVKQLL